MQVRTQGVVREAQALLGSSMNGQLRSGDTLGLWTFNQNLNTGRFPLQTWSPEQREAITARVTSFLNGQTYEKQSRLEPVLFAVRRLIERSERITVILFSDGTEAIGGTPFDAGINEFYRGRQVEQLRTRMPFITVLRAENGRITDYSVTAAPSPVEMPALPVEVRLSSVPEKKPLPQSSGPVNPPPSLTQTKAVTPARSESASPKQARAPAVAEAAKVSGALPPTPQILSTNAIAPPPQASATPSTQLAQTKTTTLARSDSDPPKPDRARSVPESVKAPVASPPAPSAILWTNAIEPAPQTSATASTQVISTPPVASTTPVVSTPSPSPSAPPVTSALPAPLAPSVISAPATSAPPVATATVLPPPSPEAKPTEPGKAKPETQDAAPPPAAPVTSEKKPEPVPVAALPQTNTLPQTKPAVVVESPRPSPVTPPAASAATPQVEISKESLNKPDPITPVTNEQPQPSTPSVQPPPQAVGVVPTDQPFGGRTLLAAALGLGLAVFSVSWFLSRRGRSGRSESLISRSLKRQKK
jgi:hypothetical protein